MRVGTYALSKLSDTQMLQYFIHLHTICHEVHHFTSNRVKFHRVLHWWNTAQKMKISIKIFYSKCDQIVGLVKFTEEIINGKLHLRCSEIELLQVELLNST